MSELPNRIREVRVIKVAVTCKSCHVHHISFFWYFKHILWIIFTDVSNRTFIGNECFFAAGLFVCSTMCWYIVLQHRNGLKKMNCWSSLIENLLKLVKQYWLLCCQVYLISLRASKSYLNKETKRTNHRA